MHFGTIAIAGALLATLAGTAAEACSCRRSSATQAIASSDVVFQGRVLSTRREGRMVFASLAVVRPIKGSVRTTVEVGTPAQSASCGYAFRPGQIVTVGARLKQQQYTTSLCTMLPLNKR